MVIFVLIKFEFLNYYVPCKVDYCMLEEIKEENMFKGENYRAYRKK